MPTQPKLQKAAMTAVKDFLCLTQDETFLVVTDEKMREIGYALYEAGATIASEAFIIEMLSRDLNGEEPPDQIASIMRKVDVVVCPTYRSLTHTDARRIASDLGVRVATMPSITLDTLSRCLSADPNRIIETTKSVAEKMKKVQKIRVISKLGTDITLYVKNRRVISSTGVLRNIGDYGNLPSGEVYLAPTEGKSNGVIVFDGSIAGIGLLKDPVTIEVKDGYAKSITGKEEADRFSSMLNKAGSDAFAIGEFGIGTNYKAKLTGSILEDEKVLGTIHIAFGNNISMGGKIAVKLHVDGLVKKPTVYFDNYLVMDNGKLIDVEQEIEEDVLL